MQHRRSATIKCTLLHLSINANIAIVTLKLRFVQSNALKCREEILAKRSAALAAHKSVTPVCLPYISNLSFVVPRARKLRKLFLPMHTTTASCIFGALYGRIDRTKFSVFTGSESAIAILCY